MRTHGRLDRDMPAKKPYTAEQEDLIHEAAQRVWNRKFKGHPRAQINMALALGISQQTVSKLLAGEYTPSPKVATEIAVLDGKETLQDLIGEFPVAEAAHVAIASGLPGSEPYKNLTVCIDFHASSKHWSQWTIAAARAGYFGNADFAPPEWALKLDYLEKVMQKARKVS
jgi:DNA-binding XRE family transcriptional regulator